MADPILLLFVILVTAFILGEIVSFLRLPRVLGYILAGFFLGLPVFESFFLDGDGLISFLTEIGILVLFFFVGLGMNIKHVKDMKVSSYLGFWSTVPTFVLGLALSLLLGLDIFTALIVGIALSVSAQAVTIDVLEETGLLGKKFGRDIVGAGVVGDIFQLLGVSIIFGLIPSVTQLSLGGLFLNWAIFFAAIFALKVIVLPLFLRLVAREKSSAIPFFFGALILALFMGYLADALGVGAILGALFAGFLVRHVTHLPVIKKVTEQFKTMAFGFFIPIFFVWIGHDVGIAGLTADFGMGVIFALVAIIGTVVGSVIAYKQLKRRWQEGLAAGWALQAKGDIELVIAAVAIEVGIISSQIFNSIIIMSVLSMIIAPSLFYMTVKWYMKKNRKAFKT